MTGDIQRVGVGFQWTWIQRTTDITGLRVFPLCLLSELTSCMGGLFLEGANMAFSEVDTSVPPEKDPD